MLNENRAESSGENAERMRAILVSWRNNDRLFHTCPRPSTARLMLCRYHGGTIGIEKERMEWKEFAVTQTTVFLNTNPKDFRSWFVRFLRKFRRKQAPICA